MLTCGRRTAKFARALPVRGRRRRKPICGRAAGQDELGATVHVLDDGFQHLQVARAVDLQWCQRRSIGLRRAGRAAARAAGGASPPTWCVPPDMRRR
jgi:hypothetical protein